jgi:hypothetical protein
VLLLPLGRRFLFQRLQPFTQGNRPASGARRRTLWKIFHRVSEAHGRRRGALRSEVYAEPETGVVAHGRRRGALRSTLGKIFPRVGQPTMLTTVYSANA